MDTWTLIRRYFDFFYTCITGYIYFQYTKRFLKRKPRDNLTPLDDIVQISPNIVIVLGQNPGPFTLQGTNTYLIGGENKRLLIDAGEEHNMRYICKLKEALDKATIEGIICTHWHHDHTGGCASIREYFRTADGEKPPVYKMKHVTDKKIDGCQNVEEGYTFRQSDVNLKVISTRGHTSDHISLYYEEEGVLFSGDCILGEGTTIFENLADYMRSLKKLLELPCKIICPGHGPIINDAKAKIEEYIERREKREKQVLDFIRQVERANPLEITRALYKGIPKTVRAAAFMSIQLHLRKLLDEGKIRRTGFVDYMYICS